VLALDHPRLRGVARRLIPGVEQALDYRDWPISAISEDTSPEARGRALEAGPYGRCVYHCDNDVVDHQIVNMELESGASVVLVMHGHSHEEARTMRYDGTRATLLAKFTYGGGNFIEIHDHLTGRVERIHPPAEAGGHGGGDEGLMAAFVRAVRDPSYALDSRSATTARESLESHLMAFAAERARVEGSTVDMAQYRRRAMACR
jgi:predicted dehydrogenase